MAAATAVPTVTDQFVDHAQMYHVLGTLAVGASPLTYTTGGIAINLLGGNVKASRTPKKVEVIGQAGYIYRYIKGTDASNGLLMIFAQTNAAAEDAPLGELTNAAAIPAAVSGDTVQFEAMFLGMN